MQKRAVLVLGSILCACLMGKSAISKPNQTTKYTYYTISGNTPGAIYTTLVRRGPRVGGVKAYAATTAVSSQSGQLTQGKYCSLENYKFKIDFTIKLPRLKNEAALKGTTKADWKKFSSFLKIHEETHRRIWLACAAALETKVKAIQTSSCAELKKIHQALGTDAGFLRQETGRLRCGRTGQALAPSLREACALARVEIVKSARSPEEKIIP